MLSTIAIMFGKNIALGSLIIYCVLMAQAIYSYISDSPKDRNKTRYASISAAFFGVLNTGVTFGLLNHSLAESSGNAYPLSIVFYGASYSLTWLSEIYVFSRIAKGYSELDFARFKRFGQVCISFGYLWVVVVFLMSVICAVFLGFEEGVERSSTTKSAFLILIYFPWAFILIYFGLLYSYSSLVQPGIGYWSLVIFLILNSIPILMYTIYSSIVDIQGGGILFIFLTDLLIALSLAMINILDKHCIYKEPEREFDFEA